ncbi:MAG: hypothetical protein ACOCZ5_03455 [bacterium]
MSSELSKLFLYKIQEMVRNKHRHFVQRNDYPDGNYIQQLAKLGITPSEAWNYILKLDESHYVDGPSIDVTCRTRSKEKVVWTFKMEIDGNIAYIKLKDESERRGCVCLSFHKDHPEWAN